MKKSITILFCFIFILALKSIAQNNEIKVKSGRMIVLKDTLIMTLTDTVVYLPDSVKYKIRKNPYTKSDVFYDSIKNKSYQNWFTKNLFDALITEPNNLEEEAINTIKSEDFFMPYKGKTIQSIRIKQLESFGQSVLDTTLLTPNKLATFANKLHRSTREKAILKFIQFKENTPLNPLVIADNERIIRNLTFIHDVKIYVKTTPLDEEKVEVIVVVQDNFPYSVEGSFGSADDFSFGVAHKNMFRQGHELSLLGLYKKEFPPPFGYAAQYKVSNIGNTIVDAGASFVNSGEQNEVRVFLDKPFITPETKTGYGFDVHSLRAFHYWQDFNQDTIYSAPFESVTSDFWFGKSLQVNRKNERQNIFITGRFYNSEFIRRPESTDADTLFYFQDRLGYLGEISFSSRNYMKSSLIYGFGITEDIPIGYISSFSLGYENSEYVQRPYTGLTLGRAWYNKGQGFLLGTAAIGGFWENRSLNDGVLKFGLLHISELNTIGRYKLRTISSVKYGKTIFNNRIENINTKEQVRGLNGDDIESDQIVSGSFEAIVFTPWYFLGFKFAPYAFGDVAVVGTNQSLFKYSDTYMAVGAGIRIRNESLVIQTIQLRFAYYPVVPPNGNSFRFEFSTNNPRIFEDFRPGKPKIITLE